MFEFLRSLSVLLDEDIFGAGTEAYQQAIIEGNEPEEANDRGNKVMDEIKEEIIERGEVTPRDLNPF